MSELLSRFRNRILLERDETETERLDEFIGRWISKNRQKEEFIDMAADFVVEATNVVVMVFKRISVDSSELDRGVMIYKLPYTLSNKKRAEFAMSFNFEERDPDKGVLLVAWRGFDDDGNPKDVTEEFKILYRVGDKMDQVSQKVQDYCEKLRDKIHDAVSMGNMFTETSFDDWRY